MDAKGIEGKKDKESSIEGFMQETLSGVEVVGEKTYMAMQFVQGIQILYFTFMDTFAFTWNEDPLFSAFRTIVKYFQVYHRINSNISIETQVSFTETYHQMINFPELLSQQKS